MAGAGEPARGGGIEHAVPGQDREDAVTYLGRAGRTPAPLPFRLLAAPLLMISPGRGGLLPEDIGANSVPE